MAAQAVTAGKIAEVIFENALETFESQQMMLSMVDFWEPGSGDMQNSGNFIWRNVDQHAPVLDGWDLTGQETGIIEQTYPAVLGTPTNDLVQIRADNLRDRGFWERRGTASGNRQASNLNSAIATVIKDQGSLHYTSNATSGFDFVSEAQAIMNERQLIKGDRCFLLNDRNTQSFAQDLAARQTLQGRPDDTWMTGQIGRNVAEFDIYTGSYIPNLVGGADPATTVTGDQSFAPEGGSISAGGVVTNVDYRLADIPVAASGAYNIGDKVTISNAAVPVQSIGLDDKSETGQDMTFTITAKPNATTITVFPKPIAADDGALSAEELAYANIDTLILNAATVDRLNTTASIKPNLFWDKNAVEVMGGQIPAELFSQFAGMKVISSTMKNGLNMYMIYDAEMLGMTMSFRLFTWYGVTMKNPSAAGVAESR